MPSAPFRLTAVLLVLTASAAFAAATLPKPPPLPPQHPVVDDYFGTKVTDPYRYFENLKDPVVQTFFKDQNAYARSILGMLDPARERLFQRIKALDASGTRVRGVVRVAGRYFYFQQRPQDNGESLIVRDAAGGDPRTLVNPDAMTTGPNQHYTINYFLPSLDGRYVSYGISEGGGENSVIHVVDADSGKTLPDSIDRAKYVGVTGWRLDGRAFYYMRFPKLAPGAPATETEQKPVNYLHVLGTDTDHDTPVLGYGVNASLAFDPNDFFIVSTSPSSPYAIATVAHGVQNEVTLYAAPLNEVTGPNTPWKKVADVDDDVTQSDWMGDTIYLMSHKDASRYEVVSTNLAHPDVAHPTAVVPQSAAVIEQIGVARDALYLRTLDGGIGRLIRVPIRDGVASGPAEVKLPFEGAVIGPVTDPRVDGTTFGLTGWTRSLLWYGLAPDGTIADTHLKQLSTVDASGYDSAEVKARSADGTMVPLSLVFKKGIKLDGSHPVYLEGYGAYGITQDPGFITTNFAWIDRGGVTAVAHVRGGGEYGEDWHLAGKMATKQHTIDDFIACAHYLIDHGYTTAAHLSGEGTSAGGILIGGAITQHPELFSGALDVVGVSDALRSEFSPNGPPNVPEFGSVKTKAGFDALYPMDAYQHVKQGVKYPAVMLITGINDPRVAPWELAKFTARLQGASASGRPILLRVDYDSGHGLLGASREQTDRLLADEFSFLLWQSGDKEFTAPRRW